MVATAVAATMLPDLYNLVMRAWLSIDGRLSRNHARGGGGDGGRYSCHAKTHQDLTEFRQSF
jgi:hypothetical protein